MATMTITVTVTGRQAGNTITWSRTATMEDLVSGAHGVGNAKACTTSKVLNFEAAGALLTNNVSTGVACFAAIHNSLNGIMYPRVIDDNDDTYLMGGFPPGLPFFIYNSYGENGFTGGINEGGSGAVPDADIEGIELYSFMGNAKWAFLAGHKLIS
jgi:hypothetical protein